MPAAVALGRAHDPALLGGVRPLRAALSLRLPLPPLPPRPAAATSATSTLAADALRRRTEPVAAATAPTTLAPSEPSPRTGDDARNDDAALNDEPQPGEEPAVDFANASLYLGLIQTVFSICCCACVSVLAVWLVPAANVSAVRTLVFCTMTGVLLMRTPLRVGRARGVTSVFTTLQPAVAVYLLCLTVEQLLHTCTSELGYAPSWRRALFHMMTLVMLGAGLMRARAPLDETDGPFLLATSALAVVALAPPPAVAFVGPLCQSVSLWEAADRVVRAFVFASLYAVHVYASTPAATVGASETLIIVARATAAAIWTMGAHPVLWIAAIAQGAIVILARLRIETGRSKAALADPSGHSGHSGRNGRAAAPLAERACAAVRGALGGGGGEYSPVSMYAPTGDDDLELGRVDGSEELSPQAQAVAARAQVGAPLSMAPRAASPQVAEELAPLGAEEYACACASPLPPEADPGASCAGLGPLSFREVASGGGGGGGGGGAAPHHMSAERMAAIAAHMTD